MVANEDCSSSVLPPLCHDARNPPDSMVALGRNGSKYFQRNSSKTEKSRYVLKSEAQFCKVQYSI